MYETTGDSAHVYINCHTLFGASQEIGTQTVE